METKPVWTIMKILNWTKQYFADKGVQNPRLDAEVLLCAVLKCERITLYVDFERPLSQQIFGSDKESFVAAAKYICEVMKPDIIDINMGCPVPKVAMRSQAGSALLKSPEKIREIVKGTGFWGKAFFCAHAVYEGNRRGRK